MTLIAGKPFTQYTNVNITDELRIKGALQSGGASGVVIVQSASDLSGTLDSTKQYVIDGVVDMGLQSIEWPQSGLTLWGLGFDVSKLFSSEDNYNLFTSPVSGSGPYTGSHFAIEVTGTNSKVHDVTADTGNELYAVNRIKYENCTSLGTITGYGQGFESETVRLGGKPSLTLAGSWSRGYRTGPSQVVGIDDTMAEALFAEGAGFTMDSRFFIDISADLGALAPLLDFQSSNFTNPSTLQITNSIVTRNGVSNPKDPTLTPNIEASDISCLWRGNKGVRGTFVGGISAVSAEIVTLLSGVTAGDFLDLAGTWVTSGLQHFDAPSNGRLRHLGDVPLEYRIIGDLTIAGTSNDDITLKAVKWDDALSMFVDIGKRTHSIVHAAGGDNIAVFFASANVELDQNDYIFIQVANNTAARDVTAKAETFFQVIER